MFEDKNRFAQRALTELAHPMTEAERAQVLALLALGEEVYGLRAAVGGMGSVADKLQGIAMELNEMNKRK